MPREAVALDKSHIYELVSTRVYCSHSGPRHRQECTPNQGVDNLLDEERTAQTNYQAAGTTLLQFQ